MNRNKKIAYTFIMGGLSSIAVTGFVWQYRRYFEAKERWAVINSEIDNYSPKKTEEIPWDSETVDSWKYRLISIEGTFLDQNLLVDRVADARAGYFVVRPFIEKNKKFSILVNCGWIPEDLKDKVPGPQTGSLEIVGIVKKDENKEVKRTKFMYPRNDLLHNLIDLNEFEGLFGLENTNYERHAFLERIINDNDDEESDLYPVLQTSKSFARPYLTPQRHRDYATFWGCTAAIGIGSIIMVLLKK